MRISLQFSDRQVALSLFVVSLLVFIASGSLSSNDTTANELLSISLLEEGDIDFDEYREYFLGGQTPRFLLHSSHGYISKYPILPGLLTFPAYFVGDLFGWDLFERRLLLSLITASVLTSLSVVFVYFIGRTLDLDARVALLLVVAYGFGTTVWSTAARGMWQHGPAVFFLTLSVLLLLQREAAPIVWSGCTLALAVCTRPQLLLVAIPLAIFVLLEHRKQAIGFFVAAAIPACLLGWYSATYYGSVFAMGQAEGGLHRFYGDPLVGFFGILVSPSRGLFVYSPFLLFGVLALVYGWKRGRLFQALALGTIFLLILYSFWDSWWGGHSFGPRLLTELVPLVIILIALAWHQIMGSTLLRYVFVFLVLVSIGVHTLGVLTYPCGFNRKPGNIDQEQHRLWDFGDSQIQRCLSHLR